ncbi:MAG: polysaccharide deacetylase family protein [Proteobacteria bacterium]|nr:polysaccharide deacetylase family protein [Pseudomonadota bacterium]MBU0968147.1 polysaccharide deacetylase family protein [Pseudomonadota bacterium]
MLINKFFPAAGLRSFFRILGTLFMVLLLHGCATAPARIVHLPQSEGTPRFIPVIVQFGDTLTSLAAKYLGDADKSWIIADFNDVKDISPGQELIIPLEPVDKARLSRKGYQTVPILTYHNFSESKEELMVVRESDFAAQMQYLKDNGYTPISLDELFDFLKYRKDIPPKAVVITIDDGWRGVYDIAYPILKKFDYPATLFIYTDLINGSRKTLSWDMVAELDKAGIDVQCHTKTHRNLNRIVGNEPFQQYASEIEHEITECTEIVERKLHKQVKYMAYPYGETNKLAIAFLEKNGYQGAFTVKRHSNPFFMDPYALNRSMVYGDFSLETFKKNLETYSNEALR